MHVAKLFFNEKELQKMEMQGSIEVTYKRHDSEIGGSGVLAGQTTDFPAEPERPSLREGIESEGSSMEVDLEDKKIRLLRDVKTKIEPTSLPIKKTKPRLSRLVGDRCGNR